MSILSCWDNIIGLTRTGCADYTFTADDKLSNSGIFLDELMPLPKFKSLLNCEIGNDLSVFMDRARETAILDFIIDANNLLLDQARLARLPFKGVIGKAKTTQVLTGLTVGNYYGVRFYCSDIIGGEWYVKTISTIFNTTGTIELLIYNNLNELLNTLTINTVANTLTTTDVKAFDIRLPLHSDFVENLEYFFIFQYAANTPRNNQQYNSKNLARECNPCYKTQTGRQFGWKQFGSLCGIALSSIADLSDVTGAFSSRMYGLMIESGFGCNIEEMWCDDELDWVNEPTARNIAKTIQYKAAINLINDLYLSKMLNRDTIIDGETMEEREEKYMSIYKELLQNTVDNADVTATDCFECDDKLIIGKTYIKT